MNRIRSWIVRTVFGKAQSEAPGDGQMRLNWEEFHADVKRGFEASQVVVSIGDTTEQCTNATEPAQESTMSTIEAGDLNTAHLGKVVTVTRDETTVTWMLAGIRHHADLIEDHRGMFDATPDLVLGRGECVATIAHVGDITLDPNSEVTVAE